METQEDLLKKLEMVMKQVSMDRETNT